MLKITKGLKQFVNNDDSEGIHIYTDSKGNEYVRVKEKGEDFCIALHDCVKKDIDVFSRNYTKGNEYKFTWNEAMEMLEDEGLTTFNREQAWIYGAYYIDDINKKLEEMGGEALKSDWYWTSAEHDSKAWIDRNISKAWSFDGKNGQGYSDNKNYTHRVRPIINLLKK